MEREPEEAEEREPWQGETRWRRRSGRWAARRSEAFGAELDFAWGAQQPLDRQARLGCSPESCRHCGSREAQCGAMAALPLGKRGGGRVRQREGEK